MYYIYNKETTILLGGSLNHRMYETLRGAKMTLTKLEKAGRIRTGVYAIAEVNDFANNIEKQVTSINMMSGKPFTQPVNTPLCCDPSSETYWSM